MNKLTSRRRCVCHSSFVWRFVYRRNFTVLPRNCCGNMARCNKSAFFTQIVIRMLELASEQPMGFREKTTSIGSKKRPTVETWIQGCVPLVESCKVTRVLVTTLFAFLTNKSQCWKCSRFVWCLFACRFVCVCRMFQSVEQYTYRERKIYRGLFNVPVGKFRGGCSFFYINFFISIQKHIDAMLCSKTYLRYVFAKESSFA